MGRKRKQDKELQSTLKDISESNRAIAENTVQTNEKLDAIKDDTEKSSRSKIPLYSLIVAVIALVVTVSGLSVSGIYDRWKAAAEPKPVSKMEPEVVPEMKVEAGTEPEMETKAETDAEEPEYTIYLYSAYSTVKVYAETEMTATLNFETDAVSITAYYESGGEDTIALKRKNATEWQKTVYFEKLGVHKVVVTAETPDGETIENSIEVEVIPLNIDMDTINQFLSTGM